jgi:glutaminyl-peptide cyclotransferase
MSRSKKRRSQPARATAETGGAPEASEKTRPARPPLWTVRSLLLTVVLAVVIGMVARRYVPRGDALAAADPVAVAGKPERKLADIPFDADQAYKYLVQICDLGPRPSGSEKMLEQQKLLENHFKKLGAKVSRQDFRVRHPINGENVTMTNLIVEWHPDKKERILLCAHYDTRPYPDRDRRNRQGRFVGANDGGSGTALLMALGDQMAKAECKYGVDFLLIDGEELVFRFGDEDRGEYFLGSDWFAREYRKAQVDGSAKFTYKYGVLFDMVADKDLTLFLERNSIEWEDTRGMVNQIWGVARRLGVREFINKPKYDIRDDHLPLHNIGKIPCCDLIDFDYPHWHTEQDTADKCSGESLAKVGRVILEWMRTVE